MPTDPATKVASDPMLPQPYRVARRRRELDDAVTLELRPVRGPGIAPFLPGQFNMLYAFGLGEIPISVSGDPRQTEVLTHTTRAVGRVSEAICKLRPGDTLGVRGPYGSAWPLDAMRGKDVVIVAGGIGLAPLRPAIYQVIHDIETHGHVSLLIGARQPDQVLFTDEYDGWAEAGAKVMVTVDTAGAGWTRSVGVVTELLPRATFDPANTVALVCGPEIMMRFAVRHLRTAGVDASDVYVTMERNMKCAVGLCGHCQYGADFVCKDGPVFSFSRIEERFFIPEI
jgi:NAD(P)H-flavin reductase